MTRFVGGIFLFALLAAQCAAGTITAQLDSVSNYNVVSININDGNAANSFMTYGFAGYVNWSQTPANNNPGIPNHFSTFCIELTQNVYFGGTYTYNLTALELAPTPGSPQTGQPDGMGTLKANAIRTLWGSAYSSNMSQIDAAAFQLAVWRLEYDWDGKKTINQMKDFTTGNFLANGANADGSAAVTAAQLLVTHVLDGTFTTMETNLVALTSDQFQDQITVTPEPASVTLGLVGGVGLILGRRFVRRKKSPKA